IKYLLHQGTWHAGLIDEFKKLFPARRDQLRPSDLAPYAAAVPALKRLFENYDIVQAYSTDPILPLLAGSERYVAFEHGTLREFIRGDSSCQRLTALAYRKSTHVFITNGDCFEHAEWLGCKHVSPMIHPIDVEQHRRRDAIAIASLRRGFAAEV